MATTKKQIDLSDEAVSIINAHTTRKSQGAWVSSVIVEYANLIGAIEPSQDECGIFERIDRRLAVIEKRTALLLKEEMEGNTK